MLFSFLLKAYYNILNFNEIIFSQNYSKFRLPLDILPYFISAVEAPPTHHPSLLFLGINFAETNWFYYLNSLPCVWTKMRLAEIINWTEKF